MNITLQLFNAYRKVQFSGRFNMLDPKARIVSGLPRDIYFYIIQNYETLQKQFGEYKND